MSGRSGWSGTEKRGLSHTSASGGTANSEAITPTTGMGSPFREIVRPIRPGSESNIRRHSLSEMTTSRVPTGSCGSKVRPASTRAGNTRKKLREATAPGRRTGVPLVPALKACTRQPATSEKARTSRGSSAMSPPERAGLVRASVNEPSSRVHTRSGAAKGRVRRRTA